MSIESKKNSSTKVIMIISLVLVGVIGYLVGNIIPITDNSKSQPNIITNQIGSTIPTAKKVAGSVNFAIPDFVKFRGADSAKINLVEFGDYQCPFCERFFIDSEPQLAKEYIDTGKAKFYFMEVGFLGPDSLTLGQGAWCADDQGKYYQYHDIIYSNQGQEGSGWGSIDKVKAIASKIQGLDTQMFNSCLDRKKYEARDMQLTQFGQRIGVTGTPTMFIGNSELGYIPITGAQPYSTFKQAIDQYLGFVS